MILWFLLASLFVTVSAIIGFRVSSAMCMHAHSETSILTQKQALYVLFKENVASVLYKFQNQLQGCQPECKNAFENGYNRKYVVMIADVI